MTVLIKSMMSYLLEEFLHHRNETILQPDNVLDHLGQRISEQNLGKYATFFYGVLDEREDTLTYANGGHFPRPILNGNGQTRFLEEKRLPIGLFKNSKYHSTTVNLSKKFVIAAFSDGVFEILKQEEVKDQQEYLLGLVDETDLEMSDLVEELKLDSKISPPDDVTLLLIRKT